VTTKIVEELSHAVLDGNYERARRLAEEWRQLAENPVAPRVVKK
jgi:hypothetical protein